MMKPITAVVIGAGDRGKAYTKYAIEHPDQLKIVGVADPIELRRKQMAEAHDIPATNMFNSYEDLLAQPKMADAAIICTLDGMHIKPTEMALEKDYHILLEKPLSNNPNESAYIRDLANKYPTKVFSVCHVLRYTPFFEKLKELLDNETIGQVYTINHNEYVGRIHQSHSFVRGNWGNSKRESPMILQKCCHDMDILYWLVNSPCRKISSFGSLDYFTAKNAPENAPKRCLDGCPHEESCSYSAKKIYLTENTAWPASVISPDTSYEARKKALEEGPYGRCVFHCDNDVVDHQVVNMLFENKVTAHLTMTAFCKDGGRHIKIMGSHGEITGDMDYNRITVKHFPSMKEDVYDTTPPKNSGHAGGDSGLMKDFVRLVHLEGKEKGRTNAIESVHSHMMAFAAEEARTSEKVVNISSYEESLSK